MILDRFSRHSENINVVLLTILNEHRKADIRNIIFLPARSTNTDDIVLPTNWKQPMITMETSEFIDEPANSKMVAQKNKITMNPLQFWAVFNATPIKNAFLLLFIVNISSQSWVLLLSKYSFLTDRTLSASSDLPISVKISLTFSSLPKRIFLLKTKMFIVFGVRKVILFGTSACFVSPLHIDPINAWRRFPILISERSCYILD